MKWLPGMLVVIFPCAAGWWGGSVFWRAGAAHNAMAPLPGVASREDPARTLTSILATKPSGTAALRERMTGLARLGMDDPQALAEALLRMPKEGGEVPDVTRDAARALAMQSPEACWQFLRAAWPDDPASLRAGCEDAAAWAYERDPAAGLAFLSRLAATPPKGLGEETAGALVEKSLESFPRKDLPLLRDWLARQAEGALKQKVTQAIMPRWVAEDLPSALIAIQAMPREDGGQNLRFWNLFNNVVKGGREPLTWEEQDRRLDLLAPEDRKDALPQLILERAQVAPEEALAQLAQLTGDSLTNSAAALFTQWAGRDPLRASRFVDSLAEPAQAGAAGALAAGWAGKNGAAASAWVAGIPPGEVREAAARSLSLTLANSHPQEALTWAGSLTDPAARQEALVYVWRTSSKSDATAALSALQAAVLPAEDKQRLRAVNP